MNSSIKLLKPYLKNWPFLVLTMLISYLAMSKYIGYTTPLFESTAVVKLADNNEGVPGSNLFKDLDVFTSVNKIATEIEVFKSAVLLNQVASSLNLSTEIYRVGRLKEVELFENSPIYIEILSFSEKDYNQMFSLQIKKNNQLQLTSPSLEKITSNLNDTIAIGKTTLIISLNEEVINNNPNLTIEDNYIFKHYDSTSIVSHLRENLTVTSADKDIPIVKVKYKSSSPVKAASIANKIAESYIQDYIDTKFKASKITVDFLNDEIKGVKKKLTVSENDIQNYRELNNITNLTQETETELRKIAQLKIQQTNLKMSLEAMVELENYIISGQDDFLTLAPNFEAFTDLLSTEIIKNIKALQSEKKDLMLEYLPTHEKVVAVDQKIYDHTSYLVESIKNTKANLETKYNNLLKDVEENEKLLLPIPENDKKLNILNREFNLVEKSYNFLNEKKIEAEIAASAKIAFHRIITPASIASNPASPNAIILKIVAAITGLILAIILIFIIVYLQDRIGDKEDVENRTETNVVATTPQLKDLTKANKHFLKLSVDLEIKKLIKDNEVLCLSSFKQNEGAKFNTILLANALAHQGKKVLLIDATNNASSTIEELGNVTLLSNNLSIEQHATLFANKKQTIQVKEQVQELKKVFQHILILNEEIEGPIAMQMISIADYNLISIDYCLSKSAVITQLDLIIMEFKLPKVDLLINRYLHEESYFQNLKSHFKKWNFNRTNLK